MRQRGPGGKDDQAGKGGRIRINEILGEIEARRTTGQWGEGYNGSGKKRGVELMTERLVAEREASERNDEGMGLIVKSRHNEEKTDCAGAESHTRLGVTGR